MKSALMMGCVGLQLAVLLLMAGEREWVQRSGREVYFRTAPVDPRDVMRGDYVRLNYGMARMPKEKWRGDLTGKDGSSLPRDTRVYTRLDIEEGVAKPVSLGLDRPADGLYLRGRLMGADGNQARVRYGMEAFFMEQGRGLELERGRNVNGVFVPLEMLAAVSPGGIAVLKDYRWCALGIGLTVQTTNTVLQPARQVTQLVSAKVELMNASSNDLAIVDLPGGASFTLVAANDWGANPWQWSPPETLPTVLPQHVIVLKPGQKHAVAIDFGDRRWWVTNRSKPGPAQPLNSIQPDWNTSFRLEYRSPTRDQVARLPQANLIWYGDLQSQRFTLTGNRD